LAAVNLQITFKLLIFFLFHFRDLIFSLNSVTVNQDNSGLIQITVTTALCLVTVIYFIIDSTTDPLY